MQSRWGKSWRSFVTEDPTGIYKRPFLPSQMVHCSNFHSAVLPSPPHPQNEPGHGRFSQSTRSSRAGSTTVSSCCEEKLQPPNATSDRGDVGAGQGTGGGVRRQVNRGRGLTSWTGPGGRRSCSRCCLCSSALSGLGRDRAERED